MCLRTNRFLGFIGPSEVDFYFFRVFYSIYLQERSTKETSLEKETEETEYFGFGDRQT